MRSRSSPAPYAWWMVFAGWLVYGFGVSPGYYSWGQFLPETLIDLDLTRAEGGLVFGLFAVAYQCSSPLVGLAIQRFGVRAAMTVGALIAAAGFLVMNRADSLADCLLGFSLLAGLGIGLGTILPTQTLATNWFHRYRATALALMMTAGGVVGKLVPRIDAWMLAEHGWRTGWLLLAGVSGAVAVFALAFIRSSPEDVGLLPDGLGAEARSGNRPGEARRYGVGGGARGIAETDDGGPVRAARPVARDPDWSAADALRTPQFAVLALCGIAFAVPWGVVVAHGMLHFGDRGIPTAVAGGIIGWMVLVSIAGRLSAFLGDLVAPQRLLGLALLVEALGLLGITLAASSGLALAGGIVFGLGFGTAYVSVSAVFGAFFGRRAFAVTAGTRMMITGVVNAFAPWAAGLVADRTGSYVPALLPIAAVTVAGAIAASLSKPPARRETERIETALPAAPRP
ncbi:MAG TPA: MFS transporter [Thermoanaerobaculia bacterium]|nr:MFS transporter [Thermoanaerobaculia bacterium]